MKPARPPLVDQLQVAMEADRDQLLQMILSIAVEAGERIRAEPLTGLRVAEIVAGAQASADDQIARMAAAAVSQLGRKVGCTAGCHRCCFQTIDISVVEAVAIVVRIPEEERGRILVEIEGKADRIAALTRPERYRQGIGCLFLEDQLCGIYEARPLACRGYLSYSRLACRKDWAERFKANRPGGVPLLAQAQMVAGVFAEGVDLAMQRAGLEVELVEISRAVAILLRPGAIDRWLAGERIFEGWRHINPHSGASHSEALRVMGGA